MRASRRFVGVLSATAVLIGVMCCPAAFASSAAPWTLNPAKTALPASVRLRPAEAGKTAARSGAKDAAVRGLLEYFAGAYPAAAATLAGAAAGPLAPTAAYYRAAALYRSGQFAAAAEAFAGQASDAGFYLGDDAALMAGLAFEASGNFANAESMYARRLATGKRSLSALVLLRAAVCAEKNGDAPGAGELLKKLTLDHPSSKSVKAGDALARKLYREKKIAWTPDAADIRFKKARTLVDRGRTSRAFKLLAALKKSGADKARIGYLEGKAYYRMRKTKKSIAILREVSRKYPSSPIRPWAMYHEAKGLWRSTRPEDAARMEKLLLAVLRDYPGDKRVCGVCARHLMLLRLERGRFAAARDTAQTLRRMGVGGDIGETAARLSALSALVLGDPARAARELEDFVAQHPKSDWAPGARYWLGRCAEKTGDPAKAADWYKVDAAARPNTYYGYKSLAALGALSGKAGVARAEAPAPAPRRCPGGKDAPLGADSRRAMEAADALISAGLPEAAEPALAFAAARNPKNGAAALKYMRLARGLGRNMSGLRAAWRTFPGCLLRGTAEELRPLREYVWPRLYGELIAKNLRGSGVDPNMVYGLIRQESFFNQNAVSGAGAVGLMQIMPATAKTLCKRHKIKYRKGMLHDPAMNVRLGTAYFLDKYAKYGDFVSTLCSYNAGSAKLELWDAHLRPLGDELFTEFIPYTETRNYVKKIMAGRRMYEMLY